MGANVNPEIFWSNTQFRLKNQDKNFKLYTSSERKPVQLTDHKRGNLAGFKKVNN